MVNYDKNRKLKIHFFEDLAQFVTNSPNFCKKIRKNCFLEHLSKKYFWKLAEWN